MRKRLTLEQVDALIPRMTPEASARWDAAWHHDSMMRFGRAYSELDDNEQGELSVWACKGFGVELARVYTAREGHMALVDLSMLYAPIDEERRRGWRGTGFIEVIAVAQASGTPDSLDALAETLEATWHDEKFTMEQGIQAVERVEALRSIVRRMRAAGMERLTDGLPDASSVGT